jgi:predicted 2-oxoglutarate/Fe(II)-dependent dioxygenase YbiX
MNTDLRHYLKIYKNAIDKDRCESIINQLQNANFVTHTFYDPLSNKDIVHKYEPTVSTDQIADTDFLMNTIWQLLQLYVSVDFKNEWFTGWQGYTRPRYNRYDVNARMENHCDHIHTMFDGTRRGIPTLTVMAALNDNYQGGELVMFEDQIIKLVAGDVIVFPSNFLYPHKIEPVTSGVRYSFVSWCF